MADFVVLLDDAELQGGGELVEELGDEGEVEHVHGGGGHQLADLRDSLVEVEVEVEVAVEVEVQVEVKVQEQAK